MRLLFLFLTSISAAFAQLNTVGWTVNIAAGVHATGYVVITPNRAFTVPGGIVVGATPIKTDLDPSTGTFAVQIYANTTVSPQPSFYTAEFHLDGTPAYSMQWVIPPSPNPCGFSCAAGPNPVIIQLDQIDTSTASAGYCITFNGTAAVWAPCGQTNVTPLPWSQTPGGTLVGTIPATVTLTGCPQGVNGTDFHHYVYISGGTGSAEAVPITGGTCTSGAPAGTITFTPANTHSGAWTIGTATAGVQEALNTIPAGGTVFMPANGYTFHATASVLHGSTWILGAGRGPTTITWAGGTTQDVIHFDGPNSPGVLGILNGIRDLQIVGPQAGGSSNIGINVDSQADFIMQNVAISGLADGINVTSTGGDFQNTYADILISIIHNAGGSGVKVDNATDSKFRNVQISADTNDPSGNTTAFEVIRVGGLILESVQSLFNGQGFVVHPGMGQNATYIWVTDSLFDSSEQTSIGAAGISIAPVSTGKVYSAHFVNTWTSGGASQGIVIGSTGTIDGVEFIGHRSLLNQLNGAIVFGGQNIVFDHCTMSGNSSMTSGVNFGLVIGNAGNNVQVHGGSYGQTSGMNNTQNYGIIYEGTGDFHSISDTNLENNVNGPLFLVNPIGANSTINNNVGIDNVIPTLASGTTVTAPFNPVISISGTSTTTTINGGWNGRQIRLIKTDSGSVTIGGGGNIPTSSTLSQNGSVDLAFNGTNWFPIAGSGGGGSGASLTALGTITTAPLISGGSGTVLTITATLGANITCGTISGFTAGQYLTLKLTQDGTGSRTFTCAGMANLGVVAPDVGKTSIQVFYAPTASTLQAMGSMWCFDCNPGIILPSTTPSGALAGTSVLASNGSSVFQWSNNGGTFRSGCYLFASGASALNTAAISSASHNLTTISATGVVTTDVIEATVNGSLNAITGYIPSTSGTLAIYGYPTADNVNFDVQNNTAGSITPGAVTVNWAVRRCN